MRHKFLVLTVKKLLRSVCIYGTYRKIKTGVYHFFGPPRIHSVQSIYVYVAIIPFNISRHH